MFRAFILGDDMNIDVLFGNLFEEFISIQNKCLNFKNVIVSINEELNKVKKINEKLNSEIDRLKKENNELKDK